MTSNLKATHQSSRYLIISGTSSILSISSTLTIRGVNENTEEGYSDSEWPNAITIVAPDPASCLKYPVLLLKINVTHLHSIPLDITLHINLWSLLL